MMVPISKKETMVHPLGRDLLSDLPLCIIHIILALVPIGDAVRTSVLSRQWRYTWATLPRLAFDHTCASYSEYDTRLNNFITQALSHHKGPIEKFILTDSYEFNFPDIDECLRCLSRKGIKEFTIGSNYIDRKMELSPSIYSCEKLTKLELCDCKLDLPLLTFKGFLFLRHLILRNVSLSDKAIESLVANSPLLERFKLVCSENHELRISAPNLKYLYLYGEFVALCVYAPLLADMSVILLDYPQLCNYVNFMGGFTNLEKLRGCVYFTKYMSMGAESWHRTLVFHHLKDIELEHVDFEDMKSVSVVVRLIVGTPNLQKLKIISCYASKDDESEAPHLSFRDFGCGPNFTFEKLRVVKMSYFTGLPLEMEFINFLHERSPVLETVDVGPLNTKDKQKLSAELLGFYRASSKAKISFGN